jgi:hypothetical protein
LADYLWMMLNPKYVFIDTKLGAKSVEEGVINPLRRQKRISWHTSPLN